MNHNNQYLPVAYMAGFCTEEALWQLVEQLVQVVSEYDIAHARLQINPHSVIVDHTTFLIDEAAPPELAYIPPKEANALVWGIGALVYYLSMGRTLFAGKGGRYQEQHPSKEIPPLRNKQHQSLNELVKRCLSYGNHSNSITLEEIATMARNYNSSEHPETFMTQPIEPLSNKNTFETQW